MSLEETAAPAREPARGPIIAAAAVVALGTLLLFAPILGFQFVNSDDGANLFRNPYIDPPTLRGLGHLWTHGYYELYMPVTYTLWAAAARFAHLARPFEVPGGGYSDLNPAVFHGMSLALHTLCALLVFLLLLRLIRKPWPAAAGALLFAIHPVQVESVAWATGMNNVTAALFGLAALLCYVDGAAENGLSAGARARRYAAATAFYILALLSKPTAASIPLIAAALDAGMLRRPPRRWAARLGLWAVLALAIAVVTRFTSADSGKDIHIALWVRPFVAGDALAVYLTKIFLPLHMVIRSDRSVFLVERSWWGYVTWLAPGTLAFLLWRLGERARVPRTGALIFAAAVLPMLGFVPYYYLRDTTVADRYLYFAMLGPGLILAWFTARESTRGARVRWAVTGLLLALLAVRTLILLPAWHDTYSLAAAQIAVLPSDDAAQTNVGIARAERGDIAGALPHFRAAAALKPDNAVYQYHLGAAIGESGDLAGAIGPLRAAVRLNSGFAEAQQMLGATLAKLGRTQEALGPLREAAALQPGDPGAHYILGVVLGNAHRDAEAEAEFARVIALAPTFPEAQYSLGRIREHRGETTAAATAYRDALRFTPKDTRAAAALERLTTTGGLGQSPPKGQAQ